MIGSPPITLKGYMADEDLELDDSTIEQQEEKNKVEKRIKSLSEKTRLASEERDAEKARAEKAEAEASQAKKDVEFFKSFNAVTSKYAGASEYQDKIKELTNKGYDLEDAAVAVLNKEGKFVPPPAPSVPRESPAGGSATTNISRGSKSVGEMTPEEKREILKENLNLSL